MRDRRKIIHAIVLDGFAVAQENYHNFANGLKWGPDGWLYFLAPGPADDTLAPFSQIWRAQLAAEEAFMVERETDRAPAERRVFLA